MRIGGSVSVWTTICNTNGNYSGWATVKLNDYCASDIRLKKDVYPIQSALNKILRLKGVKFRWKKNNQAAYGLIAQQVKTVLPETLLMETTGDEDDETAGMWKVEYHQVTALLVEAVRELNNAQKRLRADNERLKQDNTDLRRRLDEVEAAVKSTAAGTGNTAP